MSTAKKAQRFAITPIQGGVTSAGGFTAFGVRADIKTNGKEDIALLAADRPCSAAGAFTKNAIRASSVDWCESNLPAAEIRAIVCNSGCANACTGKQGVNDTARMAALAGSALGVPANAVLVASTGVIGKFLPMEKIEAGITSAAAKLSVPGGARFSSAIMTTDLRKKEAAVTVKIGKGKSFTIGGCAKGSGMIAPNMATMLAFITTDAQISPSRLSPIVKRVSNRTFNNLTVDGDTSTNDMVLVLASGASSVAADLAAFEEGLFAVCNDLCKKIAADGEGATKRVEINVKGASTEADAKRAAKAVANSNLTKCALFGNDPNWGRIACAIGYSGAPFSKEKMTILLCGTPVFKNLRPMPFKERALHALLKQKVVTIDIDLGLGDKTAIAHTCDFSYDYVKINAEYHT
jgi:glutamate N-acetyltransferase / amino-acid N-acetyltransferase